jgi:hypothetical protein
MDDTTGVSCGRLTEAKHAIEGIQGDIKIMRRRTYEIEEGQLRTNNKMIQEKKQMKLMHQEDLRAKESQNRVLNDLQIKQVEGQHILPMTSNGDGSTDSNVQAKLHTILQ